MQFDVIVVGGESLAGCRPPPTFRKRDSRSPSSRPGRRCGNFCPTHETWPGTLDSPHASINFSGNSQLVDLGLVADYGYRIGTTPVVLRDGAPDGTNCLICYDPNLTAASFARHSAADGETIFGIQSGVLEKMVEMNELAFYSPHPDTGKFEEILKVYSYVLGRSVEDLSSMTAYKLLELTFESDKARQTILPGGAAPPRCAPSPAVKVLSPWRWASSTPAPLAQVVTRPWSTRSAAASGPRRHDPDQLPGRSDRGARRTGHRCRAVA